MVQFNDSFTNSRIEILRRDEEEKLVQALAPQYGFEYINLKGYTINPEALGMCPEKKARAAKLVVFDMTHKSLSVAVQTPNNPVTLQLLEELQNDRRDLHVFMCSLGSLEHAWKRYADLIASNAEKRGVFDISSEDIINFSKLITKKDDVSAQMAKISTMNNSRRITETLELMLAGALGLRASDIHIEQEIDVRASIIPGASGESIVMRLLDAGVAGFTLDKIKLNTRLQEIMVNELKKPNGLIVTTGPTGSGKTTALYAFLRETHKEGVKIITIENPVEYKIEGIVQTQTSDEYTFSSGLRAILRQDPDVILVGEIRDREVAETALHAAQTGHLVFSTLHANNAAAAFPRLIDLGVDPRVLGTSINIILGQRLVRVLCEECKAAYPASPAEVQTIKQILDSHPGHIEVTEPLTLYKAVGCPVCRNTGYKGRLGIFEAIMMDEAVEEAVIRDPREHIILEAAASQQIPTMLQDGMEKVIAGITSLDELERVIEIPLTADTPAEAIEPGDDTDAFLAHIVT